MTANYTFDLVTLSKLAKDISETAPEIWDEHGQLHFDQFAEKVVKPCLNHGDFNIHIDKAEVSISPVNSILTTDVDINASFIVYCPTLNPCRKRFSIIKELCQLYIDSEFKHTTKEWLTVQEQMDEAVEGLKNNLLTGSIKPEQAALVLAIELCIPWKLRKEIHAMNDEPDSTHYDIAKRFMIPEYVIDRYFDDYGDVSDMIAKWVYEKRLG